MKIKKVTYPTSLDKIVDRFNDNIDVFVETEDGLHFTMTVCTPSFYSYYMEKEKIDYIPASTPDIIVKELTYENIFRALENFCVEDGYWLKAYYLLGIENEYFSNEKMIEIIRKVNES